MALLYQNACEGGGRTWPLLTYFPRHSHVLSVINNFNPFKLWFEQWSEMVKKV